MVHFFEDEIKLKTPSEITQPLKRFSCSEDVAGAMVVAIGLLLPDLIETFISVFVEVPNVGFGKLVGGISFNLLIYLAVAGNIKESCNEHLGVC